MSIVFSRFLEHDGMRLKLEVVQIIPVQGWSCVQAFVEESDGPEPGEMVCLEFPLLAIAINARGDTAPLSVPSFSAEELIIGFEMGSIAMKAPDGQIYGPEIRFVDADEFLDNAVRRYRRENKNEIRKGNSEKKAA